MLCFLLSKQTVTIAFRPMQTVRPLIRTTALFSTSKPPCLSEKLQAYSPTYESSIYQWWEASGCFDPDAKGQSTQSSYILPMPPPNVTGRLHLGHAIFVTLQDVLARFHRQRGRPVLWLPGTDHAGIATQLQVEKLLQVEGTTRQQVGRDEFLRRVWEYKEDQGGAITSQLRSLGASADWKRERFTMDNDLSVAVTEAFVRLHDKGLVYRGAYMVNWAPLLQTAVSDLEVEYSEEEGKLYYFKYMVDNDSGGKVLKNHQSSLSPLLRLPSRGHDPSRNHCGRHGRLCASRRRSLSTLDWYPSPCSYERSDHSRDCRRIRRSGIWYRSS